ncbi:TetR/AcrR family transcriptional regulator [Nocardia tengchongensis]|uniref:TetR/AcrR family transcriptional regulator n=1 Tax=Nocardia tengchongensis TaxID=2055889 RepID=A0ABX8CN30_9NOCA|nr:TetR/AcrR family transcriptional regulator [Nocardia tengchongensis]QVI20289.1 TetR/AcrR family transcriptional regulator [Nocardia tengchongensis]
MAGESASRRAAPPTRRGQRTRGALIAAAREVFERDGYLDAKIADISKTAGMAAGSFYTYFDSKEEIFAALVEQVSEEMLHPHVRERSGITDPRALIEAANRDYLLSYKRNARLMALFEQVAQIDENFRRMRLERGKAFAQRNARMIRELQESGQASADLDPMITAHALSSMVSRMASMVFVQKQRIPFEKLVTTLTQLWVNALQLKSE